MIHRLLRGDERQEAQGHGQDVMFCDIKGDIQEHLTRNDLSFNVVKLRQVFVSKMRLSPGDKVLLIYEPGLNFLVCFIACLSAGIVAVPTYPPIRDRMASDMKKTRAIIDDSKAKAVLTTSNITWAIRLAKIARVRGAEMWPTDIPVVTTDDVVVVSPNQKGRSRLVTEKDFSEFYLPSSPVNELAYLQYTSGSTGDPKGVMISFDNIEQQIVSLIASKNNDLTSVVSWLPQYHDLGLVAFCLVPLWKVLNLS